MTSSTTMAAADLRAILIDTLPADARTYVGSPSIAVLADGTLVASHDIFGPGSASDRTVVFASSDGGRSWQKRAEVEGQFWSNLFVHRGKLYLMGTAREFGPATIRRSDDAGRTWTTPTGPADGVLADGRFHTAPTPIVEHAGRLWRAMEDIEGPGGWPTHFRCFVWSARMDANLLRADAWTRTAPPLLGDPRWLDGHYHGWLEGNVVVGPDDTLVDLLRVDAKPVADKAAIVRVRPDGSTAIFAGPQDLVTMPGGSVKFTVRFDPKSARYWAFTNALPTGLPTTNPGITRNTLALISSIDLRTWDVRSVVWRHHDVAGHGWQYVDWQFDGDDLVAVVRAADDGAHDFHDANHLVFFRLPRFRSLGRTTLDATPVLTH